MLRAYRLGAGSVKGDSRGCVGPGKLLWPHLPARSVYRGRRCRTADITPGGANDAGAQRRPCARTMQADMLVHRVLDDEGLTAGLEDPEARMLVEWLVEEVEELAAHEAPEAAVWKEVESLCRRSRGIRRFLSLWCHTQDHGAASQLAASEHFTWPLPPAGDLDPCQVLEGILDWEQAQRRGLTNGEEWDY